MKRAIGTLMIMILTAGAPVLTSLGDEPKKPKEDDKKVSTLMKKKLQHSQKVLEGVVTNDFKMISKHAEELIDLSKQAEWRAVKSKRYELHSDEFRRDADKLIKNAKEKNGDAAALTYVELTLTCVRCHKYVREEGMARLDK
jgi:hypothetical protein